MGPDEGTTVPTHEFGRLEDTELDTQVRQFKVYLVKIMVVSAFCLAWTFGCTSDVSTRDELEKRLAGTIAVQTGCPKPPKGPQEIVTDEQAPRGNVMVPGYNKVSSTLRTVVDAMVVRGITRQNAKELRASTFSNQLVQVSDQGNVQTYIYVSDFRSDNIELLKSYEVIVEIVNEQLKVIQGWIPFNRIYDVAQLPFITRITPPSYGIPQQRRDPLG
jgi:hypothetical protein